MNAFEQLCEIIEKRMQEFCVPGVAAGVWSEGHEQVAALGITSVENPLLVTTDTLFQTGSISKTMLATAAMRLVESGKIDLDCPVRRYIPHLRLADDQVAANLTMRHLLTHTGGWAGDYFNDFGWGKDALRRMVASLGRLPQLTPLGSTWHYNNAGFAIAGRVMEVACAQPFETVMADLLFQPLGMNHSFYFPEEVMTHRFVVGHKQGDSDKPEITLPWAVKRANHPAGGVVSNIPDLMRYARFHLGDGRSSQGERLLDPRSLAEMRRPQASPGVSADAMGLTWFIKVIDGVTIYRHGGSTHGQNAQFCFVPERNFAFAILSNANRGEDLCMQVYKEALRIYLGLVEQDPVTFSISAGELEEFCGIYQAQAESIELTPENGGVRVQVHEKGGFPTPATLSGPDPKPSLAAFYATDHIFGISGPEKGSRAEFLRDTQGKIEWLRIGGRIHRKVR